MPMPCKVFLIVLILLLLTSVAFNIVFLVRRGHINKDVTTMDHFVQAGARDPGPQCTAAVYTVNITLSRGPLLLNITDIPECFTELNPGFPAVQQGRLLASGGYWEWIFDAVLNAYIQVWVEKAVNFESHPVFCLMLLVFLLFQ